MPESITGNSANFPTSTTVPVNGDIQIATDIKTPVKDLMDRTEHIYDRLTGSHHDGVISPKIDLTTDVVGVLPAINGGSGVAGNTAPYYQAYTTLNSSPFTINTSEDSDGPVILRVSNSFAGSEITNVVETGPQGRLLIITVEGTQALVLDETNFILSGGATSRVIAPGRSVTFFKYTSSTWHEVSPNDDYAPTKNTQTGAGSMTITLDLGRRLFIQEFNPSTGTVNVNTITGNTLEGKMILVLNTGTTGTDEVVLTHGTASISLPFGMSTLTLASREAAILLRVGSVWSLISHNQASGGGTSHTETYARLRAFPAPATNISGDGTQYVIQYVDDGIINGMSFNDTTGELTINTAGKYAVQLMTKVQVPAPDVISGPYIVDTQVFVGGIPVSPESTISIGEMLGSATQQTNCLSTILDLNAADILTFVLTINSGLAALDSHLLEGTVAIYKLSN